MVAETEINRTSGSLKNNTCCLYSALWCLYWLLPLTLIIITVTGCLVYRSSSASCNFEENNKPKPEPLPTPVALHETSAYSNKENEKSSSNKHKENLKSGDNQHMENAKPTDVRLPQNLRPHYYKVNLIPYLEEEKFFTIDGTVAIDISVVETTNRVSIHIKNITIREPSVTVQLRNGQQEGNQNDEEKAVGVVSHDYDVPREFYNVTLNEELQKGRVYRVRIEFTALLTDSLAGFYRSSYKDLQTKETRWMAVTMFQPTDARRAFPCFDEPSMKAEFEISLGRKTAMTSISNMDLRTTEPIAGMTGWVWDHYHRSIPMSTYLVAFAVAADFLHLPSDPALSTVKFGVWARKDAIKQAEFAANVGPRILTFFEHYFNISFPLPKMDLIALPDLNVEAMENWGLVTFRERTLLFDVSTGSKKHREDMTTIIAHELSHQWFGNLVTPSWWSDLWLNEGFATYVEYIGADHIDPMAHLMHRFVVQEVYNAFALDALETSHPINAEVQRPDEIAEIFDEISYSKGACIIRMMNHFLTERTFKAGLQRYLNQWKYKSATQNDLWTALTEQAWADKSLDPSVTVATIMDTWTLQKGYPLVHVERDYSTNTAKLTQTKFRLVRPEVPTTKTVTDTSYRWWIPISYASPEFNSDFSITKPQFWMRQQEISQPVRAGSEDWIIVNVQQTGFYRVSYDLKNWQLITQQLKSNYSAIHVVDRGQLLGDALTLARAFVLPYSVAFDLMGYIAHEEEYLPWEVFFAEIAHLAVMLWHTPVQKIFEKYMRGLLEDQFKRVGFKESDDEASPVYVGLHQRNIIHWSCAVGNEECTRQVKEYFKAWMSQTNPNQQNAMPVNLRRIIYCHAVRNGGEAEWDFLWQRYEESNVASEKSSILKSLACAKDTEILRRFLNWTISPSSGIRKQDGVAIICSIALNKYGHRVALDFVQERWPDIVKYFPESLSSTDEIIESLSHRMKTRSDLQELQNFKTKYFTGDSTAVGAAAFEQSLERVMGNIQWMEGSYRVIQDWLQRTTGTAISN